MTEIFTNISDEVKKTADIIWRLALAQKTPMDVAQCLHTFTEFYKSYLTEEEIEFLQFYFHMKMEMIKQ